MIKQVEGLLRDDYIAEVSLDNGEHQTITWSSLIEYLNDERGYNLSVVLNEETEDEDYDEEENKDDYWNRYWEEIEIDFQQEFLILGIYNAERQGGILVVWDTERRCWCYESNADYLYSALIVKQHNMVLHFCYISNFAVRGYHYFAVGPFKENQQALKKLDINWEEINYFNPEEYKIMISSKMKSIDSSTIDKYGYAGIYYSEADQKVYFYDCGGMVKYDIEYLKGILK